MDRTKHVKNQISFAEMHLSTLLQHCLLYINLHNTCLLSRQHVKSKERMRQVWASKQHVSSDSGDPDDTLNGESKELGLKDA
jgi:hypothetical protein